MATFRVDMMRRMIVRSHANLEIEAKDEAEAATLAQGMADNGDIDFIDDEWDTSEPYYIDVEKIPTKAEG